jgi:peptidoglycan/xylan/chitin deacetylase (PgdA/CDA1 family)
MPDGILKRASNVLKRVLAPRDGCIVLMYHRVGAPGCDPEHLAVTAENLGEQIAVLKQRRDVVPLSWLRERLAQGLSVAGTAAVTFDDGYADVLHQGRPVLARLDCPATVFLATGTIGTGANMWWDLVGRLFLATQALPPEVKIVRSGGQHRIVIDAADRGSRMSAYREISEMVRPLPSRERDAIVDDLARQIWGARQDRDDDRLMTQEEVLAWYDKGMFEIGAHTVSHPSLPTLPAAEQKAEIAESCRACTALTGEPPTGFAYPYGHYDAAVVDATAAAGITIAVTAEKRRIGSGEPMLALPRYYVGDWDAATFARQMSF